MLIVNYFPGSLGDTVITYLKDIPYWTDYVGSVKLDYPWNLKTVDFYESIPEQQRLVYSSIVKPWLEKNNVIGAHRFNCFDFKQLDPALNVLTIDPRSSLDYVAPLFINKVQKIVGYYNSDTQALDTALAKRYGDNSALQIELAKKQIIEWCDQNIISGDVVIDLAKFLDNSEYIKQFQSLMYDKV